MTSKEKAKDARLRREFGITLAMFNAIWEFQGRCCYICRRSKGKKGQSLLIATDHNHLTGEIRGLLCWQCNKAIAVLTNRDHEAEFERGYQLYLYLFKSPVERVFGKKIFAAPGRVGTKSRAKLLKKRHKISGEE
jgi:recombination endonuclease VII